MALGRMTPHSLVLLFFDNPAHLLRYCSFPCVAAIGAGPWLDDTTFACAVETIIAHACGGGTGTTLPCAERTHTMLT